jgi:hypothetical protein
MIRVGVGSRLIEGLGVGLAPRAAEPPPLHPPASTTAITRKLTTRRCNAASLPAQYPDTLFVRPPATVSGEVSQAVHKAGLLLLSESRIGQGYLQEVGMPGSFELVLLAAIALIPAFVAQNRGLATSGAHFLLWWLFGLFGLIPALVVALVMPAKRRV